MRIDHIAIWTKNLEEMKDFYVKYFNMKSNSMYRNSKKNFSSYFLTFPDNGCRIELMHIPKIASQLDNFTGNCGLCHFAISLGSKENVDRLTQTLAEHGYTVASQPRTTGDGYYESLILDPEGNKVELTN